MVLIQLFNCPRQGLFPSFPPLSSNVNNLSINMLGLVRLTISMGFGIQINCIHDGLITYQEFWFVFQFVLALILRLFLELHCVEHLISDSQNFQIEKVNEIWSQEYLKNAQCIDITVIIQIHSLNFVKEKMMQVYFVKMNKWVICLWPVISRRKVYSQDLKWIEGKKVEETKFWLLKYDRLFFTRFCVVVQGENFWKRHKINY